MTRPDVCSTNRPVKFRERHANPGHCPQANNPNGHNPACNCGHARKDTK